MYLSSHVAAASTVGNKEVAGDTWPAQAGASVGHRVLKTHNDSLSTLHQRSLVVPEVLLLHNMNLHLPPCRLRSKKAQLMWQR